MRPVASLLNTIARNVQIDPASSYASIQLTDFLNGTYKQIWESHAWPLLKEDITVQVPAHQSTFTLPKRIGEISRAFNVANAEPLRILELESFVDSYIGDLSTSPLQAFAIAPVLDSYQLATPQTVKASSTSASDTACSLFIKGVDATGELLSETLALNGTTVVTSTHTYAAVWRVVKSKVPTVGTVVITDNSGSTQVATISPWEYSPVCRQFKLSATAPEPLTIRVIGKQGFRPFVDKLDVPFMEMDNALIAGTTALAWAEIRNPEQGAIWSAKYDVHVAELLEREINQSGQTELMVPSQRG